MSNPVEDLKLLIRTRHAIVVMCTTDEPSAARVARQAGFQMGMPVMEWSINEGLHCVEPPGGGKIMGTGTLLGALKCMADSVSHNVYVLKDAISHLKDAAAERAFREVAMSFTRDSRTVFMIDTQAKLPASLTGLSVPYDLALPDEAEIRKLVKKTLLELTEFGEPLIGMDRAELSKFLANLRGLTRLEISQVMASAILPDGKLDADDINRAIELKRQRFQQAGVLDYIPAPDIAPKVGGMAGLRDWLKRRENVFTKQAREYGLETPRGILMLGVQGCGKSLMARVVASQWSLPLLRMDVGALYDKYVGQTEKHLRQAFKVASGMAPCVMWIDEIEKAFASAGTGPGGAQSDGGLSQRMFGQLLTWMQDRAHPVFLVATANDISALPPELMRKGRFDEIFFVDLPGPDARQEIFKIHLARRKRDSNSYDVAALVQASNGFSGSEIEQAIVSAMYAAFNEEREFTTEDIIAEMEATQPISIVMAEKIAALRQWAQGRCVSAG